MIVGPAAAAPTPTADADADPGRDPLARRARRQRPRRLAVGHHRAEPEPLLARPARATCRPSSRRWRDAARRDPPALYRLVARLAAAPARSRRSRRTSTSPHDGCLRGKPPCAAYAGVRDQLARARLAPAAKGGWEVLVVITGTPDWAAAPAGGLRARRTRSRARAPLKAAALAAYRKLVDDVIALGAPGRRELRYWSAVERAQPPVLHLARSAPPATRGAAEPRRRALRGARRRDARGARRGARRPAVRARRDRRADAADARSHDVDEFLAGAAARARLRGAGVGAARLRRRARPGRAVEQRARRHRAAPRAHAVWITETGVGAPHAGGAAPRGSRSRARGCRALHDALMQLVRDPRVTAAFQYTFREDDMFPTGLVTTDLTAARPVLARVAGVGPAAGSRRRRRLLTACALGARLGEQPERERGEADHHAEHPVLRAHGELDVS